IRHGALAADDRDRALPLRAGQSWLAADENADEGDAERGREMQQAGVDADDELRGRDATRELVERPAIGNTRSWDSSGDAFAALPLRVGAPCQLQRDPARGERAAKSDPPLLGPLLGFARSRMQQDAERCTPGASELGAGEAEIDRACGRI